MGGLETGNFPLLYVVKMYFRGGWVVQKGLKTSLRNIKMAPYLPVWFFKCQICAKYSEVNTLQISGYYF